MKRLLAAILQPTWVAFTTADCPEPELGLKIWGVIFALYKGGTYVPRRVASVRQPFKREFGESLHPTQRLV